MSYRFSVCLLLFTLPLIAPAQDGRAGLGRNAGFVVVGPPMDVRADHILDSSDESKLAKTDPVTLYKWDEDGGGWLGYTDLSNTVAKERGAALFLFDDSEDAWTNDTFTLSFVGPTSGPTDDLGFAVNAGTDENSWFASNPYIGFFDPRYLRASAGKDLLSVFTEHVQFWNYAEDEWEYYSFGDSTSTMTSVEYRFLFPSQDGFFVEAHTSGQDSLVFGLEGKRRPSTIESEIGPSPLIVEDNEDLIVPRYGREDEQWVQLKVYLLMRGGQDQYLLDDRSWIYFYQGAQRNAFDRHDATKLNPMTSQFAAIGLEGTKFGAPRMQSILSLPPSPSLPIERPLRVATRDLQGTLEIVADSSNLPSGWGIQITDTKKTSDTADDVSTQLGKEVGEGYRFQIRNPRPDPSGPPDLITRQDSADAGVTPRFRIKIDQESNL
jgi:hypothetical protein